MTRKTRIDSAAEVVRIMSKATMKIVPPAHVPLSPEDMPFFESVIAEFAKSELTDHQIELVALLARTMADLNESSSPCGGILPENRLCRCTRTRS